VGGPSSDDSFVDNRQDYVRNEVALDYNAGERLGAQEERSIRANSSSCRVCDQHGSSSTAASEHAPQGDRRTCHSQPHRGCHSHISPYAHTGFTGALASLFDTSLRLGAAGCTWATYCAGGEEGGTCGCVLTCHSQNAPGDLH
jgi:hypothetical protein